MSYDDGKKLLKIKYPLASKINVFVKREGNIGESLLRQGAGFSLLVRTCVLLLLLSPPQARWILGGEGEQVTQARKRSLPCTRERGGGKE